MSTIKFHEVSVIGTPILDLKRFFNYYDELKTEKGKWPFYLYSFNSIDTFSVTVQSNKILKIINNNSSETSDFLFEKYIDEQIINLNSLFKFIGVKSDDLKVSIDNKLLIVYVPAKSNETFEKSKELFIYKLEKQLTSFVNFVKAFNLLSNLGWEDFLVSFNKLEGFQFYIEQEGINNKHVGEFLYDFSKKEIEKNSEISVEKFIENLYFSIIEYLNSIEKKSLLFDLKKYLFLIEEYSRKRLTFNFFDELKEFIKLDLLLDYKKEIKDNEVIFIEKHILDLIGRNANEKYFSNPQINRIVLENFYIGQAFGKKMRRNALDRIAGGHKKLTRVQAEINEYNGKKELAIILFRIEPKNLLFIEEFGTDAKKAFNQFLNFKLNDKTIVDLTELALITYFKPKYNVQHVGENFKKMNSIKIKEIVKNNDGIVINMGFEEVNWEIKSSNLQGVGKDFSSKNDKIIQYRFNNNKLIKSSKIKNLEDVFLKESQTTVCEQNNSRI